MQMTVNVGKSSLPRSQAGKLHNHQTPRDINFPRYHLPPLRATFPNGHSPLYPSDSFCFLMSSSHPNSQVDSSPFPLSQHREEMPEYFHQAGLMLRVSPGSLGARSLPNRLGVSAPAQVGLVLLGNSKPWTPSAVTLNFS